MKHKKKIIPGAILGILALATVALGAIDLNYEYFRTFLSGATKAYKGIGIGDVTKAEPESFSAVSSNDPGHPVSLGHHPENKPNDNKDIRYHFRIGFSILSHRDGDVLPDSSSYIGTNDFKQGIYDYAADHYIGIDGNSYHIGPTVCDARGNTVYDARTISYKNANGHIVYMDDVILDILKQDQGYQYGTGVCYTRVNDAEYKHSGIRNKTLDDLYGCIMQGTTDAKTKALLTQITAQTEAGKSSNPIVLVIEYEEMITGDGFSDLNHNGIRDSYTWTIPSAEAGFNIDVTVREPDYYYATQSDMAVRCGLNYDELRTLKYTEIPNYADALSKVGSGSFKQSKTAAAIAAMSGYYNGIGDDGFKWPYRYTEDFYGLSYAGTKSAGEAVINAGKTDWYNTAPTSNYPRVASIFLRKPSGDKHVGYGSSSDAAAQYGFDVIPIARAATGTTNIMPLSSYTTDAYDLDSLAPTKINLSGANVGQWTAYIDYLTNNDCTKINLRLHGLSTAGSSFVTKSSRYFVDNYAETDHIEGENVGMPTFTVLRKENSLGTGSIVQIPYNQYDCGAFPDGGSDISMFNPITLGDIHMTTTEFMRAMITNKDISISGGTPPIATIDGISKVGYATSLEFQAAKNDGSTAADAAFKNELAHIHTGGGKAKELDVTKDYDSYSVPEKQEKNHFYHFYSRDFHTYVEKSGDSKQFYYFGRLDNTTLRIGSDEVPDGGQPDLVDANMKSDLTDIASYDRYSTSAEPVRTKNLNFNNVNAYDTYLGIPTTTNLYATVGAQLQNVNLAYTYNLVNYSHEIVVLSDTDTTDTQCFNIASTAINNQENYSYYKFPDNAEEPVIKGECSAELKDCDEVTIEWVESGSGKSTTWYSDGSYSGTGKTRSDYDHAYKDRCNSADTWRDETVTKTKAVFADLIATVTNKISSMGVETNTTAAWCTDIDLHYANSFGVTGKVYGSERTTAANKYVQFLKSKFGNNGENCIETPTPTGSKTGSSYTVKIKKKDDHTDFLSWCTTKKFEGLGSIAATLQEDFESYDAYVTISRSESTSTKKQSHGSADATTGEYSYTWTTKHTGKIYVSKNISGKNLTDKFKVKYGEARNITGVTDFSNGADPSYREDATINVPYQNTSGPMSDYGMTQVLRNTNASVEKEMKTQTIPSTNIHLVQSFKDVAFISITSMESFDLANTVINNLDTWSTTYAAALNKYGANETATHDGKYTSMVGLYNPIQLITPAIKSNTYIAGLDMENIPAKYKADGTLYNQYNNPSGISDHGAENAFIYASSNLEMCGRLFNTYDQSVIKATTQTATKDLTANLSVNADTKTALQKAEVINVPLYNLNHPHDIDRTVVRYKRADFGGRDIRNNIASQVAFLANAFGNRRNGIIITTDGYESTARAYGNGSSIYVDLYQYDTRQFSPSQLVLGETINGQLASIAQQWQSPSTPDKMSTSTGNLDQFSSKQHDIIRYLYKSDKTMDGVPASWSTDLNTRQITCQNPIYASYNVYEGAALFSAQNAKNCVDDTRFAKGTGSSQGYLEYDTSHVTLGGLNDAKYEYVTALWLHRFAQALTFKPNGIGWYDSSHAYTDRDVNASKDGTWSLSHIHGTEDNFYNDAKVTVKQGAPLANKTEAIFHRYDNFKPFYWSVDETDVGMHPLMLFNTESFTRWVGSSLTTAQAWSGTASTFFGMGSGTGSGAVHSTPPDEDLSTIHNRLDTAFRLATNDYSTRYDDVLTAGGLRGSDKRYGRTTNNRSLRVEDIDISDTAPNGATIKPGAFATYHLEMQLENQVNYGKSNTSFTKVRDLNTASVLPSACTNGPGSDNRSTYDKVHSDVNTMMYYGIPFGDVGTLFYYYHAQIDKVVGTSFEHTGAATSPSKYQANQVVVFNPVSAIGSRDATSGTAAHNLSMADGYSKIIKMSTYMTDQANKSYDDATDADKILPIRDQRANVKLTAMASGAESLMEPVSATPGTSPYTYTVTKYKRKVGSGTTSPYTLGTDYNMYGTAVSSFGLNPYNGPEASMRFTIYGNNVDNYQNIATPVKPGDSIYVTDGQLYRKPRVETQVTGQTARNSIETAGITNVNAAIDKSLANRVVIKPKSGYMNLNISNPNGGNLEKGDVLKLRLQFEGNNASATDTTVEVTDLSNVTITKKVVAGNLAEYYIEATGETRSNAVKIRTKYNLTYENTDVILTFDDVWIGGLGQGTTVQHPGSNVEYTVKRKDSLKTSTYKNGYNPLVADAWSGNNVFDFSSNSYKATVIPNDTRMELKPSSYSDPHKADNLNYRYYLTGYKTAAGNLISSPSDALLSNPNLMFYATKWDATVPEEVNLDNISKGQVIYIGGKTHIIPRNWLSYCKGNKSGSTLWSVVGTSPANGSLDMICLYDSSKGSHGSAHGQLTLADEGHYAMWFNLATTDIAIYDATFLSGKNEDLVNSDTYYAKNSDKATEDWDITTTSVTPPSEEARKSSSDMISLDDTFTLFFPNTIEVKDATLVKNGSGKPTNLKATVPTELDGRFYTTNKVIDTTYWLKEKYVVFPFDCYTNRLPSDPIDPTSATAELVFHPAYTKIHLGAYNATGYNGTWNSNTWVAPWTLGDFPEFPLEYMTYNYLTARLNADTDGLPKQLDISESELTALKAARSSQLPKSTQYIADKVSSVTVGNLSLFDYGVNAWRAWRKESKPNNSATLAGDNLAHFWDCGTSSNYQYYFYIPLEAGEAANANIELHAVGRNDLLCSGANPTGSNLFAPGRPATFPNASHTITTDVVGRVGGFTVNDTGDFRYQDTFKVANTSKWDVYGLINKVTPYTSGKNGDSQADDKSRQNLIAQTAFTDTSNPLDYTFKDTSGENPNSVGNQNMIVTDPFNIRGRLSSLLSDWGVSSKSILNSSMSAYSKTSDLNTYGSQWQKENFSSKPKYTLPLTAEYNKHPGLHKDLPRLGYKTYCSFETIGGYYAENRTARSDDNTVKTENYANINKEYGQEKAQVIPVYIAVKTTKDATGNWSVAESKLVDAYMLNDKKQYVRINKNYMYGSTTSPTVGRGVIPSTPTLSEFLETFKNNEFYISTLTNTEVQVDATGADVTNNRDKGFVLSQLMKRQLVTPIESTITKDVTTLWNASLNIQGKDYLDYPILQPDGWKDITRSGVTNVSIGENSKLESMLTPPPARITEDYLQGNGQCSFLRAKSRTFVGGYTDGIKTAVQQKAELNRFPTTYMNSQKYYYISQLPSSAKFVDSSISNPKVDEEYIRSEHPDKERWYLMETLYVLVKGNTWTLVYDTPIKQAAFNVPANGTQITITGDKWNPETYPLIPVVVHDITEGDSATDDQNTVGTH